MAEACEVKIVTLIRHGVAAHNISGVQDPDPGEPARYTDSPLTDRGRKQASSMSNKTLALGIELLVCAPLSRAIDTGLLAFPQVECVVAHEDVREYCARRYANKRLAKSELEAKYTGRVDFSLINSEVDPLFNVDKAEAWPAGPIERAQSFIHWIMQRPEKRIAVASHGVFLEVLLRQLGGLPDGERVHNCELRNLTLRNGTQFAGVDLVAIEPVLRPQPT